MSAIESAFVNTVVAREECNASAELWAYRTGGTQTEQRLTACAQHDTTGKKISGLKMWRSKSVVRDKSGYVV
jgi:hypothetical protein